MRTTLNTYFFHPLSSLPQPVCQSKVFGSAANIDRASLLYIEDASELLINFEINVSQLETYPSRIRQNYLHNIFVGKIQNKYLFLPAFSTPSSSRDLSQRRDDAISNVRHKKKKKMIIFTAPPTPCFHCFHSIRNRSGIDRKAICRARHAHRARCTHHGEEKPDPGTNRKLFARSLPQDRNNPLSHCRTPCTPVSCAFEYDQRELT